MNNRWISAGLLCSACALAVAAPDAKRHGLPWGDGHLGDLPALTVDATGAALDPVLAPRLKLADVKGRALMIPPSLKRRTK